jgi:hypothetical protein
MGIPVFAAEPPPIRHKFRHFDEIRSIGKNYDNYGEPIIIDRTESDQDLWYGSANSEIIGVEDDLGVRVFEILITDPLTGDQRVRTMDTHNTYLRFRENSWD